MSDCCARPKLAAKEIAAGTLEVVLSCAHDGQLASLIGRNVLARPARCRLRLLAARRPLEAARRLAAALQRHDLPGLLVDQEPILDIEAPRLHGALGQHRKCLLLSL